VTVLAGATLLAKGQAGSSFYILIDGQVRVHDGQRTLATLGEGDVLGELTLLDPAPRSDSVTAVTDTRLFRLDQEPFHELLDDQSEIAWKMLQLLARRLRRSQGQSKAERARDDLLGGLKEKLVQKG
jgi:CRP-like cAMP-binding protein